MAHKLVLVVITHLIFLQIKLMIKPYLLAQLQKLNLTLKNLTQIALSHLIGLQCRQVRQVNIFFYTTCHFTGSTDQSYHIVEFFKNGSVAARSVNRFSGTPSLSESLSLIFDLGVGDYMEVYVKQNLGSDQILRGEASERKTYFVGFKLV